MNDDIEKYVSDKGVTVHSIETVLNPNAKTKSFMIEIPYKDKDKVMSENFWYCTQSVETAPCKSRSQRTGYWRSRAGE